VSVDRHCLEFRRLPLAQRVVGDDIVDLGERRETTDGARVELVAAEEESRFLSAASSPA